MSKRAKAKGSHYEREFVRLVQDCGLSAQRVPLSGAMQGYKDDVVVCDTFRVECKYRKDGTGFKRLHDWFGASKVLHLVESGLYVMALQTWCAVCRTEMDTSVTAAQLCEDICDATKNVTAQKGLLDWMGEADALALRRAGHGWLVCIKDQKETP